MFAAVMSQAKSVDLYEIKTSANTRLALAQHLQKH